VIEPKIDHVLKILEAQEILEQENPTKVNHSEKMLAITRPIGLFYNILLRGTKAKKILEIGTSVGYSTIWFAESIRELEDAKITTIEQDEKKIVRAQKNFDETGLSDLIEIRHGDALKVLSDIQKEPHSCESYDFVFIDADKERYIQYFDMVFPLVKTGGIIGADNILLPERFSAMIRPYIDHVRNNPKIRSVTIPIDNGEELSIKLG